MATPSFEEENKFYVREDNDANFEMDEIMKLYEKYNYGKINMKLFLELFEEEKRIAQQRCQLLKDLKLNFKEEFLPFIEKERPDFFI